MSQVTLLARLTPLIRNLTDLSLKLSGKLIAYDNVTLYRYSIKETEYRDQTKTLLQTVNGVHMYIDFPGEVPHLNTTSAGDIASVTFVEDLLPIVALFPWKHQGRSLNVDKDDEFEISLYDENKKENRIRFEITERRSDYVEQHVYREFIVVPVREEYHPTPTGGEDEKPLPPASTDPNITPGEKTYKVYSEYD